MENTRSWTLSKKEDLEFSTCIGKLVKYLDKSQPFNFITLSECIISDLINNRLVSRPQNTTKNYFKRDYKIKGIKIENSNSYIVKQK